MINDPYFSLMNVGKNFKSNKLEAMANFYDVGTGGHDAAGDDAGGGYGGGSNDSSGNNDSSYGGYGGFAGGGSAAGIGPGIEANAGMDGATSPQGTSNGQLGWGGNPDVGVSIGSLKGAGVAIGSSGTPNEDGSITIGYNGGYVTVDPKTGAYVNTNLAEKNVTTVTPNGTTISSKIGSYGFTVTDPNGKSFSVTNDKQYNDLLAGLKTINDSKLKGIKAGVSIGNMLGPVGAVLGALIGAFAGKNIATSHLSPEVQGLIGAINGAKDVTNNGGFMGSSNEGVNISNNSSHTGLGLGDGNNGGGDVSSMSPIANPDSVPNGYVAPKPEDKSKSTNISDFLPKDKPSPVGMGQLPQVTIPIPSSPSNITPENIGKEGVEYAQNRMQEWENTFGSVEQNIKAYLDTLTPDSYEARGITAVQTAYASQKKHLEEQLAQRGLDSSGAYAKGLSVLDQTAAQNIADVRIKAPEEVNKQKMAFLNLGMQENQAITNELNNAYSSRTQAQTQAYKTQKDFEAEQARIASEQAIAQQKIAADEAIKQAQINADLQMNQARVDANMANTDAQVSAQKDASEANFAGAAAGAIASLLL